MVPVTSVPVPAGQPLDGNVVIVHGTGGAGGDGGRSTTSQNVLCELGACDMQAPAGSERGHGNACHVGKMQSGPR